jgi:hypothetical protein
MDFIHVEEKTEYVQLVPQKIFIIPYRNRIQHKFFLSKYMTFLLEDEAPGNYEIYFSHQSDTRPFNRGAVKNIGFLAMKNKYPAHYKDMTFIFNDVDTMPFDKIFNYDTHHGVVTHLYGFNFALGGIVIFKGADFEKINGYPNYWGWGMEDNVLQQRCLKYGVQIDRGQFVSIGCQDVLQLFDGIKRIVVRNALQDAKHDNGIDGIRTIRGLRYEINVQSTNPDDNVHVVENPYIYMINIFAFKTLISPEEKDFENYDLRDKPRSISESSIPMQITKKNKDPDVNVFSPQYARQNNIKDRATKSVNIRMGGLR